MSGKNKLKTGGYFAKRLKDNGFIVLSVFKEYHESDPRIWTILVDPGNSSTFITCYKNKDNINEYLFELNDGGKSIPKNYYLKTDSMEVVIQYLVEKGVLNNAKNTKFYKEKNGVNTNDETTSK